jgi:hypothetical protein
MVRVHPRSPVILLNQWHFAPGAAVEHEGGFPASVRAFVWLFPQDLSVPGGTGVSKHRNPTHQAALEMCGA